MGQKRKSSAEPPAKKIKVAEEVMTDKVKTAKVKSEKLKPPKVKVEKEKAENNEPAVASLLKEKEAAETNKRRKLSQNGSQKKKSKKAKGAEVAPVKKTKWTNKTRVLVFSTRGIAYQGRHLMNDLQRMMPHSKTETKLDRKEKLFTINELAEMKNCSKTIFLDSKKGMDLYLWLASTPNGPSAKFQVENVHTMLDLKLTGNCLRGSRPLLSFDKEFDNQLHWQLLKEMLIQIFSTPNNHPKSQPFFDRVAQFTIACGKIWCRQYEIADENGELIEIGPRMVLNPIRIFKGSFCGETLYMNPKYTTPNKIRSLLKRNKSMHYQEKVAARKARQARLGEMTLPVGQLDDVFQVDQD